MIEKLKTFFFSRVYKSTNPRSSMAAHIYVVKAG